MTKTLAKSMISKAGTKRTKTPRQSSVKKKQEGKPATKRAIKEPTFGSQVNIDWDGPSSGTRNAGSRKTRRSRYEDDESFEL